MFEKKNVLARKLKTWLFLYKNIPTKHAMITPTSPSHKRNLVKEPEFHIRLSFKQKEYTLEA
jgi:hypothetical protein